MRSKSWGLFFVSALVLCIGLSTQGSASDLDPTANEMAAARSVWQLMGDERFSYLIRSRDEKLAVVVAHSYLDAMDPEHLVFLSSDIEKFTKKPMWSLAAMQGRAMVAPLRIHEIFEERVKQRQLWLSTWVPAANYPRGASWVIDRAELPWPATIEEQNSAWQKYMDSAALAVEGPDGTKKVADAQKKRLARAASLPRAEVMEAFVNSFARSIDPHASYMLPDSAERLAIDLSLSLDGIGATLVERDGGVFVEEVVPGGPAFKSGTVKSGDRILAIAQDGGQWVDARELRSQDAVKLIRGKAGTKVKLRLAQGGDEINKREIVIVRDRVILSEGGATEKIIESDGKRFGWIKLPGFYGDWRQDGRAAASATKDVEAALVRLKKAGVDGVILDLRDNGGGSLTEAVGLVGLFLPPSDVVQILGADEKLTQMKSPQAKPVWDGPLALLVNRGSASASEIAAGALQDHGRAIIMGDQTFGKGTVQSVVDLDQLWENEGPILGQMKMTIAQFFLPSGRSTQLSGVVPDILIPATLGQRKGEDAYKNAAPAAHIPPVKGLSPPSWKVEIPQLQAYARTTAAASEDFRAWVDLQKEVDKLSEREGYLLNAAESAHQRASDDAWRKDADEEMKRLGMGKEGGIDPVVKVAASVVAKWVVSH